MQNVALAGVKQGFIEREGVNFLDVQGTDPTELVNFFSHNL